MAEESETVNVEGEEVNEEIVDEVVDDEQGEESDEAAAAAAPPRLFLQCTRRQQIVSNKYEASSGPQILSPNQ